MTRLCAICGGALTSGTSAGGLCARCLLTSVLADDGDSDVVDSGARTTFAAGTTIGSLRIVRTLGRGGMATVYEAHDARLDRAVALKVLPPEFLHDLTFAERFEQEARLAAALEHPNIVPIYASGIDHGIPWMSMRLLAGGTIGSLLEGGRPDVRRVVRLLRSVANALDYAHARGIVHRDIKPTNILLDGAGGACVGDFGLAYILEVSSRMTPAGLLAGTPEYMAPEQALGKAVDHRCDIYSLAVVAYEMFAGSPPFTAESPVGILLKQVNDTLPEPPEQLVPGPIMRAIHKGAAKEPADRWASATAFVDALEGAMGPQEHRTAHSRIQWMTAVGVAIVVAATAGWLATRKPGSDAPSNPIPSSVNAIPKAAEPTPLLSPVREGTAPMTNSRALPRQSPQKEIEKVAPEALTTITTPITDVSPRTLTPVAATSPAEAVTPARAVGDGDNPGSVSAPPRDIVTVPTRIRSASPKYPQAARAAQFEGDVLLEAIVSAAGKVTNVTIVRSVHPLLDDAARAAVLQYEYAPARRNGVPEPAAVRLTVSFRMH